MASRSSAAPNAGGSALVTTGGLMALVGGSLALILAGAGPDAEPWTSRLGIVALAGLAQAGGGIGMIYGGRHMRGDAEVRSGGGYVHRFVEPSPPLGEIAGFELGPTGFRVSF